MIEFSVACAEESENVKKRAQESVDRYLHDVEMLAKYPGLVDGVAMCSDYCFNTNPFFSPEMFSEFVAPYLEQAVRANRELGFYTIKHTDGNIMPILDQIVQCRPDAIHSLDPQAGVRLGEVKRMIGDKVCLIGNVNCGLLQTGTDEEVIADVRRALREGMPGYGYIFSTSNCVYTGMRLSRYELMNKIWYEEGIY
jgi:uroporphyrinogen decarboxylase